MGHSAKMEGITRVSKDTWESLVWNCCCGEDCFGVVEKRAPARKVRCWLVGKKERSVEFPLNGLVSALRQIKDIPNYFRLANLSHEPFRLEIAVRFTLFYNITTTVLIFVRGTGGVDWFSDYRLSNECLC